MKHVFLDYASTTPVDKLVFEAMRPYFDYMSMVLTTDLNGEDL